MTPIVGRYTGNVVSFETHGVVRKRYAREDHYHTERDALSALAGCELPVPRLLAHDCEAGKCHIDMTRLPGVVPAPGHSNASPHAFGRLARRLHDATRARDFRSSSLRARESTGLLSALDRLPTEVDVEAVNRLIVRNFDLIDGLPSARALIHRDLRWDNLLYDEVSGELGLIDFEVSAVGRPEGDLSRVLLVELAPAERDPFLNGYGIDSEGFQALPIMNAVFAIEMLVHFCGRHLAPEEIALRDRLVSILNATKAEA